MDRCLINNVVDAEKSKFNAKTVLLIFVGFFEYLNKESMTLPPESRHFCPLSDKNVCQFCWMVAHGTNDGTVKVVFEMIRSLNNCD
jgi:hypothetical protein